MVLDGTDHFMTVEYDIKCMATCPRSNVEQYVTVRTALGWSLTEG